MGPILLLFSILQDHFPQYLSFFGIAAKTRLYGERKADNRRGEKLS